MLNITQTLKKYGKELVNIKTKNISTPTSIEIDNSYTSDPKLICNSFNNYFANIADDILKTRKFDGKKSYTECLNNPVPNSFVFDLCDASEVDAILSN